MTMRSAILLVLAALAACVPTPREGDALRMALRKEFRADAAVQRDGTRLEVTVWDLEGTASEDADADMAAARKVAEYVRDHYAGYGALAEVDVTLKSRTGSALTRRSSRDAIYAFPRRDLGAPRRSAE